MSPKYLGDLGKLVHAMGDAGFVYSVTDMIRVLTPGLGFCGNLQLGILT
jgi:hypothetical protein